MKDKLHFLLLGIFLAAAVGFVILNFFRSVSPVENALFQILISATGLLGSYLFGKSSARAGALDVRSTRRSEAACTRGVSTSNNFVQRSVSTID